MVDLMELSLIISSVALIISTTSIILSVFTLRRQGIPDRFEVRRRIWESIEQHAPDGVWNSHKGPEFEIAYITVKRESGFTSLSGIRNLVSEYISGELQGITAIGVQVNNGKFRDDFAGEVDFSSKTFGEITVTVGGHEAGSQLREVTIPTANASDVDRYVMWLLSDEIPEFVSIQE